MADEQDKEVGAPDAVVSTPATAGGQLRTAREAQGLSLADVAIKTRIAQRQLEAIERDDYAMLPGIPYAIGFARAYARAVDIDEVAIAAQVRQAVHNSDMGATRYEVFEPADPARVPSRALAWGALAIVLIVVAVFAVWRAQLFSPSVGDGIVEQDAPSGPASAGLAAAPASPVTQAVVFTARDDVWLRIYDEAGERLKDGMLKQGETFTLPADARNPMILTGRPQSSEVTVGGKLIAPLGPADRTIADVPVSAAALLAREAPAATSPAPDTSAGTSSVVSRSEPALRADSRRRPVQREEGSTPVPQSNVPSSPPPTVSPPVTAPEPSVPAPATEPAPGN